MLKTPKYPFAVTWHGGDVCSEHGTRARAEKAVRRLVAMSNGKLTANDFSIRETVQSDKGSAT